MISNMLRFPFSMFDDEMERLLYPDAIRKNYTGTHSMFPDINIGTTDKSVDIYLFVPGIKPEKLELVIEKKYVECFR